MPFGSVVIDGHVDSAAPWRGALLRLREARAGDAYPAVARPRRGTGAHCLLRRARTDGFGSDPVDRASQPTSPAATAPSPTGSIKPLVVQIRNNAYVPAAPAVVVGQPIEVINDDAEAHTWSAVLGSGWSYTSDNLDPGKRATFPGFTKPGSYRFVCYYHGEIPSMNGVVTVKEAM
jgi:plastocyanin